MSDAPSITMPAFTPLPFLVSASGGDAGGYVHRFRASAPDFPALGVDPGLAVADEAERASLVPEAALERLSAQERQALDILDHAYPIPASETFRSSHLTFLTAPAALDGLPAILPPGTAVYVRSTDAATIRFVLPFLRVDTRAGQPVIALPRDPDAPTEARRVETMAAMVSPKKMVKTSFSIVKAFKFMLPKPYGDHVGAGMALIELLMGGDGGTSIDDAVEEIETYLETKDAQQQIRHVKLFSEWLSLKLAALGHHKLDQSTDYVLDDLLPNVAAAIDRTDTESLLVNVHALEEDSLVRLSGGLDRLCLAVAVYLLALKLRVQIETVAAAHPVPGRDVEIRSLANRLPQHYEAFRLAMIGGGTIKGWDARIEALIQTFRSERLARIGPTTRGTKYNPLRGLAGGHDNGYGFVDEALRKGIGEYWTAFFADTQDNCCAVTEHRPEADRSRDAHVKTVTAELDAAYADHTAFVEALRNQIVEWPKSLALPT